MFAAPLKSNSKDAAITTVFGKAKWFGIYNPADNSMKVIAHTEQGAAIIGKLKNEGVTTILTKHLGGHPLQTAEEMGMKVFYPGDERMTLIEAVSNFQGGSLEEITMNNIDKFHNH